MTLGEFVSEIERRERESEKRVKLRIDLDSEGPKQIVLRLKCFICDFNAPAYIPRGNYYFR